jgi:hypothetical protein
MRHAKRMGILAAVALFGAASMAGAQVISGNLIYSDTFSNTSGSATTLNGHTPDTVDATGASWVSASAPAASGATDAILGIPSPGGMADISGGTASATAEDSSTITDAYLPVTIVAGSEYDLAVSVAIPTVNSGGHGAFIGFINATSFNGHNGPTVASNGIYGSTVYPDVGDGSAAMSNLNPYGLILARDTNTTNDVTMFQGLGTGVGSINTTDTSTAFNNYDIVLNTQPAQWTLSQYLNGTLEQTYTFSSNPSIGFVGIGVNRALANFENFSVTQLPEPTFLSLMAVGGLFLAKRRRMAVK